MRHTIFVLALVFSAMLVLVGCGSSGGEGPSFWEKAAQGEEDDQNRANGQSDEEIYAFVSGVYANPGNSYELLLLYDDATYALGNPMDFYYGNYTADESAMTISLLGQGIWDIGTGFAYVVDDTGDPWAKILEDILKDGGDEGRMTESEAENELVKFNAEVDEIFTEEELEEMDRQAMEELADGGKKEGRGSRQFTPGDVAATYGTPSMGDTQLTLNADGTYEEGHGLQFCCGLYRIEGNRIYFMEDPLENLTAIPSCGYSVTIGDNGQTLIDEDGNVWRREPEIEHDPYDPF